MSSLHVEVDGPVRHWTLNRPDARNALDSVLFTELLSAATDAASDSDCRVVVMDGAPPLFCAGSDLDELGGFDEAAILAQESRYSELRDALAVLDAPVVASVAGAALGGGLVLMLYADVRITDERAQFSLPEVELGWIPPAGIEELIDAVGFAHARRLVLLGTRIRGRDAATIGLVDDVAPRGDLERRTRARVDHLLRLSPAATAGIKRYLRMRRRPRTDLDALQLELFGQTLSTKDARARLARRRRQA